MATLKVNGVLEPPQPSELSRGLPQGSVVVKHAVRVSLGRAAGPPLPLEDLRPDDVVEIELQDGLRLWSQVQDVVRDLGPRSQRGVVSDTIELPSVVALGPASRGAGGWAIKALKVLGLDLEGEIAGFVAAHVEGKLQPGPGLYRCSESAPEALQPVEPLDGKGPVLVFLHGTASSTGGSFAGLWTPDPNGPIQTLFKYYEGRVLAYQHRSLTLSPIDNALALAEALASAVPGNTELHIVSHSRGGLVGELLARGMRLGAAPITADDLALFEEDVRAADRKALESLSTVLEESRFRVTRFARVACPARGTTLADRRLDRYFTVLVNLASLIPALKASPMYDALTSLLAGVLKKRTDPKELPGLEAMMPTSPLVRMLNRPDVASGADLHVIGGDLAGAGLFGRLKTLVTDFYYRDDHDLVVNTPAMLGGMERTSPVKYWIDTGDKVTHFHYFGRPDTSRRVVAAVTGAASDFRELKARPSAVTSSDYVKRAMLSRPVVVVLPGIMGSQLSIADRPVWMNILQLARGGLSLLRMGADGVKATGLLSDGYAALCEYLAQTHEVVPFPYDWRRTIAESAALLQGELARILPLAERANQPVRILAHSMGGLVVRAMLSNPAGRDIWTRACQHPAARFIMLGTPNGGSHAISALLIGRDALVKKLALVDLQSDHSGLLTTIASFDGVLNLLPHAGTLDLFDRAVWERLLELDAPQARGLFGSGVASSKSAGFRWSVPAREALAEAKRLAAAVRDSPLDPRRTVYVAGVADQTACDLVLDEGAKEGQRVKVMASSRGDGRVLWETGIPPGVPTFFMDTVHGDLASDRRHFPALLDLLHNGSTTRLATSAPGSRAAEERFELHEPEPAMVPDEAELVSDALGGRRVRAEIGGGQTRISIRMVHDNLTNARFPVLASHYRNDVIVAAEAYLDARLEGRLSELLHMELYPGPINTGVVVLNEVETGDLSVHPGAIVAGLGLVGELTPGSLTSTLAHSLTLYGAERVGRERRRRQRLGEESPGGTVPAPVTAILIGSGEGGVTLSDSVRALLRAVLQANQRLRGPAESSEDGAGSEKLVAQIDQVEILELYEDRAIEALHTLLDLLQAPEFDSFTVQRTLFKGAEGRRRARFEQAVGWWQRIRVTSDKEGALAFEAVTQSARATARLRPTQRGLVDGFVQRAIESTANDPRLGQTLFELLVPNDFKAYAPERRKLALMLNPEAAAIPWELMYDGFDRWAEPLSVASGMIRQLLLEDERRQVLRSPVKTALVIGNPLVADPRFPPLPGAAEEAGLVADLLGRDRYQVELLVGKAASPMTVLSAVHEKPWKILHLAAHGVFEFRTDPVKEPVSGLVLDNGLFFTAAEAEQLRYVPELVFINCCHLGQTRGEGAPRVAFHRLAANLATQFIRMGARAVVAAGWEVDDAAAKTFATTFYTQMLGGALYGDAILRARKDVHTRHGETNTWGAYQCYGDVSFSLRPGGKAYFSEEFVSDRELEISLETVAMRARQPGGAPEELLEELDRQLSQAPPASWASAELCNRAGQALEELGQFGRAIDYYSRVLTLERAAAPIAALERLANCKVRRAAELLAGGPKQATQKKAKELLDKAEELLDEAEKVLGRLLDLGETAERRSLLGGAKKRRAQLVKDDSTRRDTLREMSAAYQRAYQLSRAAGSGDAAYPLANQIAADIVLSWRKGVGKTEKAALLDLLRQLQDEAAALAGSRTDVFSLSAAAEHQLLLALAERQLDDARREAILGRYTSALSRGATARQRDSIRTQLRFFRNLAKTEFPQAGRTQIVQQLERLDEQLFGKPG